MNVQMSVYRACERGKEKKERHFGLSTLPMLFSTRYHWGRALQSDYSRIRMAVLDLEKKTPSRTTAWKRAGEAICVAHFSVVSANGRTIPKSPGVSIKDGRDHDDGLSPVGDRREGPSLLLSANSFLLKPQSSHNRRMCGLSGPEISNFDN